VDEKKFNKLTIQVFGWKEKFKKILSEIFIAIEDYELEIVKITFSSDGFLTVEEKDLKTIFLGFKPNLINNQFQKINYLKNEFEKKGLIFSGMSPDNKLPEIIELKNHPWFIGVQFHPEFKSRPLNPHPLFSSFIKAAKNHR